MSEYQPLWSPYFVGIMIGLLNLSALYLSNKPLAASTTYLKLIGLIRKKIQGDKVLQNPYYKKKTPKIDWGVMLVFGIVIGSFSSAILSGTWELSLVPELWADNVSPHWFIRVAASLLGGIFLGVGARWAGGCTSGHGISGVSQLSVTSMVASTSFFVGGILTAFIIYH